MNTFSKLVFSLLLFSSLCQIALAEGNSTLPSHCKPGEFAYLNAGMGKFHINPTGDTLEKNGKVLSICVDKPREPFGKVTYRYGAIGHVEMEQVATPDDKFEISSISQDPHSGDNIFAFHNGAYTYYVAESTGMGTGVGLSVLKSGKRISSLFSGNNAGTDYESGLVEINFDKAASPVFRHREPRDSLYTIFHDSGF